MHIKEIELENFRNYEKENICFQENINIITGKNAQGKTNLLESIYFVSFTKSFRTNRDSEMVMFGKEYCRAKATYQREEEETVEVALSTDGKKGAKIDGRKVERFSELVSSNATVVFSPEDLKIIKDEPGKRRSFLDRELCQLSVSYYNALLSFKKSLYQRNSYLKEEYIDEDMLSVWDEGLIREGTKIIDKRNIFVQRLSEVAGKIHEEISGGSEHPEIKYETNVDPGKDITENYRRLMEENRAKDKERGNTSIGPHRDDIDINIAGKSTRYFGSQGQQRTAALALKLAEIELIKEETGEYPILLLDDVFSELDEQRQRYLVDYLDKMQVFITAADIPEKVIKTFPKSGRIEIENGSARVL